jgi:SAM-dependent methyltransferase
MIYEKPKAMPHRDECYFYHTMTYPDGETVSGRWTIPNFADYIGNYDIKGKTVLDVGTASGYIAFNAEQAGAAEVTGFDMQDSREELRLLPFAKNEKGIIQKEASIIPMKNSWWYGWHKNKSKARCIYAPIGKLYECDLMVDIVIAGAIVEHISDPVYAIGAWAKVAREAIIIPFTPYLPENELYMKPLVKWNNPENNYTWWVLSAGLYHRVFDNLNFDVSFNMVSTAEWNKPEGVCFIERPTIIAKRRF